MADLRNIKPSSFYGIGSGMARLPQIDVAQSGRLSRGTTSHLRLSRAQSDAFSQTDAESQPLGIEYSA